MALELFHGKDLRLGRFSQPGGLYLVTTVTNRRRSLFRNWYLGRVVVAAMREVAARRMVDSLAWVLMPDHLHWLFGLKTVELSHVMHRVKYRSGLAINRQLGSVGPVWQRGYHDHALRREEDVRAVARYIVANPLRAGLVDDIGDYPLWDAVWL